MRRDEILLFAEQMETRTDLVELLNKVKSDALGDKAYSFQLKQITYYCNPKRSGVRRYINFTIPKKSGGVREISAPVRGLKSILFSLNTILQAIYTPSKYAMGFTQGRSVVDNANMHIGQRYVYNIDLKDFFPSIDKSRVWARLKCAPFNFNDEIANTIAGLCSIRIEKDGVERFVLPQGAPTSPLITNAICDTLDRRLGALAKRFGMRYSRYADDITFSSMHYVYGKDGNFIKELHRIISDQNFAINEKKTRLQILGKTRQEVTGLTISEKINVARKYSREIKSLLHIWNKYGYVAACESYIKTHCANEQMKRAVMPRLDAVIAGKLQYMKMVKGADDTTYQALHTRFNKQISSVKKIKFETENKDISYLCTMSLSEFEEKLSTRIEYNQDNEPILFFTIDNVIRPIVVSKSIDITALFSKLENSDEKREKYQISLCESGNTQFYMLHKKLVNPKFTTPVQNRIKHLQEVLSELVSGDLFSEILREGLTSENQQEKSRLKS